MYSGDELYDDEVTSGPITVPTPAEWAQASYERQVERASTPDPDSLPCEWCGGGLDHYPECGEV